MNHKIIMEAVGNNLLVSILLAEALITTAAFTIIRFGATLNPFVMTIFLIVGGTAVIVLHLSIKLAVNVTLSSKMVSELGNVATLTFSEDEKKFFKSCNLLKSNIGNTFTLSTYTFRRIMNDIIIQTVINLLIAY